MKVGGRKMDTFSCNNKNLFRNVIVHFSGRSRGGSWRAHPPLTLDKKKITEEKLAG